MSAVLIALFREYQAAERVRTKLVKDGFPTDRVELTASLEPGQAALVPAASRRAKLEQYFRTLMSEPSERPLVDAIVARVEHGAAAIAVHPRGDIETQRATKIFDEQRAVEVLAHDLDSQSFEHAASSEEGIWVRHLIDDSTGARD
jgi:hypothetical protein